MKPVYFSEMDEHCPVKLVHLLTTYSILEFEYNLTFYYLKKSAPIVSF